MRDTTVATVCFMLTLFCVPVIMAASCKQEAKTALDLAQISCILAAPSLEIDEVAQICKLVDEVKPLVGELLVHKALARKATKCTQE